MNSNEKYLPALRFRYFSSSWKENKLDDLATIVTGKLDANAASEDGEYAFFTCGRETLKTNTFAFDGDSIIISGNGDLGFTRKYSGKFNAYQRTYVLQDFKINYEYLEHAIHSFLPERIKSESFGGAMPYIKLDTLAGLVIPTSDDKESECIAHFLNDVDRLIFLSEQKRNKVISLKCSLLEKMFPRKEKLRPNLRFNSFKLDWEICKLGDVIKTFYNGQTPYRNNKDFWNGNINWLSSGELTRGFVDNTIEKITDAGMKDANLKVVPRGTFVIAITGLEAAGTRGNCGILNIDTTMNQSCMALIPFNDKATPAFLIQWYHTVSEEYGQSYTQGTKQQSYTADILKKLPITISSSIEEQKKIGSLFSEIDKLIIAYKNKIDLLKSLKQSFLKKMFA